MCPSQAAIQASVRRCLLPIRLLIVARGNRFQAKSPAVRKLFAVCVRGPRYMSLPMRFYRCSMRFRFGEFAGQGKDVKSSQTVKSSPCDMWPSLVLLEYRVGCTQQKGENNRLYNLCDAAVHCKTVVNVYQRYHVIKYYATSNHDARCRIGLTLGELNWFVAFSESLPYPSMVVIPPQTGTRFICEQYPMSFDGPGTMTMAPYQVSIHVMRGHLYSCCWYP
ncbi:hypothetical protein TNCV_3038351 [Trichonephila clavipes]|nr:hypothetical protein TNCV_3038351 [Trichonephila clavipes]